MVQQGPQKHDVAPANCGCCQHVYDDCDENDDVIEDGDDDNELKPSRQQEGAKVP